MMRAGDLLASMAALPFADIDTIAPGTSLILAPHADDESLGCGGLIAAACARGRAPLIVAVTDGTGSHPNSPGTPAAALKSLREAELRAAAATLGVGRENVHFLALPDTRAPCHGPLFDTAVQRVANLARAADVTTIFTTWHHDPHGDHVATALIGAAAARLAGVRLAYYPVWGWLLPQDAHLDAATVAGRRLEIGMFLARKRRAIAAHASQYSDLIDDDPGAFRLPPELLAVFDRPFEVFLHA